MATMWAIAKYAALTVAGIVLFRIGTVYAYRQRGYTAVGGEVFALFLPAIYYAVSRTIKDFIADVINGYTPEFKEDEEE
jgi:formate hydrogenlyase subunit 3/multisubunit Na+/H+ antiporter MnhD subunit